MRFLRQKAMDKIIFFYHIEKCGGTTFHHLMRYNYPTYFSLSPNYSSKSDLTGGVITEKEIRRLFRILPFTKGVGGHTLRPSIDYQSVIGKDIFRLTFLREPVSRFLSHLNYLGLHLYKDKDFDKYMERKKYENFMTKRLAGKEDVEVAKRILIDNFDFVGFTEMFDESLLILLKLHGKDNFSPFYEKRNVLNRNKDYRRKGNMSEEFLQRIKDKNDLDIQLYKFAVENIYERLVSDYGPAFTHDVKQFQKAKEDHRFNYFRAKAAFFNRALYYSFEKLLHM